MPSTCLPLYTPTSSIITRISTPRSAGLTFHHATTLRKLHGNNSITCKASSSSSSSSLSSLVDFDLYDLLGIESSSDQWQIKMAYRKLQKRCHPDIAGPAGHDMAIILNEVYSVLSDPNLRLAYDKVSHGLWLLKFSLIFFFFFSHGARGVFDILFVMSFIINDSYILFIDLFN